MKANPRSIFHIRYHRFFFPVNDNFLTEDIKTDAAINYFIQCPVNTEEKLQEFYTLLIDLRQTEEQIWAGFYHRTRSEILSFTSNQEYQHVVDLNPSRALLSELIDLYNGFARFKKIRPAEAFRLKAYLRNQILAVSYIRQSDAFVCVNFYRLTRQRATNLYSFHVKHHSSSNSYSASHYGRAHRALHWLDIKKFKLAGTEVYDFCGWYHGQEDKQLLNINKFKEQFATLKVKEYSGVIYKNRLLHLLHWIRWRS